MCLLLLTHLDQTMTNGQIDFKGYNIIKKDRNKRGGVILYIQEHLLFNVQDDQYVKRLEILWIQIHLPTSAPWPPYFQRQCFQVQLLQPNMLFCKTLSIMEHPTK